MSSFYWFKFNDNPITINTTLFEPNYYLIFRVFSVLLLYPNTQNSREGDVSESWRYFKI